jgi:hypothetical protein
VGCPAIDHPLFVWAKATRFKHVYTLLATLT